MSRLTKLTTIDGFNQSQGYKTSSKYVPINTIDAIKTFEANGFTVSSVQAARCKAEKTGFQKHLVRLRPANAVPVNGLFPEIVWINSYDGTTANKVFAGIYRLICANGLVAGTTFDSHRIVHLGDALNQTLIAIHSIAKDAPNLMDTAARWSSIQLTNEQAFGLANQALKLILPASAVSSPDSQLLKIRRYGDNGTDLFSVFNRIQENALRVGVQYLSINANGQVRNASTRTIKAIDRSVDLNRELWDLASQYAA